MGRLDLLSFVVNGLMGVCSVCSSPFKKCFVSRVCLCVFVMHLTFGEIAMCIFQTGFLSLLCACPAKKIELCLLLAWLVHYYVQFYFFYVFDLKM
jgi:hypothetical protein